ncbi:MAG: NAD(P)H-dependent oxidoreductase [Pseudohongiellaceae bacterium]
MRNVLRITTSILGETSVSAQLMEELLAALADAEDIKLTERDFASQPIPHFDNAWLTALSTAAAERNEEQQQKVDYSNSLIAELQAADTVIIGLPMYNFSVPSMLKAWIDHVARAGVTFKYTDSGSVGLLHEKKVYLVTAMGGLHEEGGTDFLRPYMRQILSFLGLNDVQFVTAAGLNISPERREKGLAAARNEIENLVSRHRVSTQDKEVAA